MGSDTLIPRSFGQKIVADWFNVFKRVLAQDIVSRNTTGAIQNLYGSLGNSSYRWNQAHLIEKRLISGSNYVALKAPTLSADVDFKWPQALPTTYPSLFSFDSSGAGQILSPDSTLDLSGTLMKLAALGLSLDSIAGLSPQFGTDATSQTLTTTVTQDWVDIPNHSKSFTTTGNPVFIGLAPVGNASNRSIMSATNGGECRIRFLRGATEISGQSMHFTRMWPNAFFHIDTPAAGTYTYKAQGMGPLVSTGPNTYQMSISSRLLIFEWL